MDTLDWQTSGSLTVVGAFAASEVSAAYLQAHPASPFAWYLNLELFGPFEQARSAASPLRFVFAPDSLAWALAAILAVLAARALRLRFGVALLANLAFVGAVALAHAWSLDGTAQRSASLGPSTFRVGDDGVLVGLLLASSFVAFALSHLSFVGAIRSASGRPDAAGRGGSGTVSLRTMSRTEI